jgi:hypothetical protein
MLYTKDVIRMIDEKMYVPKIEKVLEKVEAFKKELFTKLCMSQTHQLLEGNSAGPCLYFYNFTDKY